MKIYSFVGTLMLLLASMPTFAGNLNYIGTLSYIGADWNGVGYIFAIHGVSSQCGVNGEFSTSAPGYKDQVATLMLAWAMGQSVEVTTDDTNSCPNSRANIIAVRFYPPV